MSAHQDPAEMLLRSFRLPTMAGPSGKNRRRGRRGRAGATGR